MNNNSTVTIGSTILVTKADVPDWLNTYFSAGETGVVTEIDGDGDVWADFSNNEEVSGDGIWCLQGCEFHVINASTAPSDTEVTH